MGAGREHPRMRTEAMFPFPLYGFQLLPLLHAQRTPQRQHQHGVCLFQTAAGGEHQVNLCAHLGFVHLVGLHQRLQAGFLPLQVGAQVNELEPVFEKRLLDL